MLFLSLLLLSFPFDRLLNFAIARTAPERDRGDAAPPSTLFHCHDDIRQWLREEAALSSSVRDVLISSTSSFSVVEERGGGEGEGKRGVSSGSAEEMEKSQKRFEVARETLRVGAALSLALKEASETSSRRESEKERLQRSEVSAMKASEGSRRGFRPLGVRGE